MNTNNLEPLNVNLGVSRALEWDRFIDLALSEARTIPGKSHIENLRLGSGWASDIHLAKSLQLETQEVTALLDRDGLWGPLMDLEDPADILDRLSRGAVLEVFELVTLRRWLYALDSWTLVPRDEIRGEKFKKALTLLPNPSAPLRILNRVLTPEGELSEKASARLGVLYSEIRSLKREIGIVLDQLLKTFSQKGILQENFSDVRDGRYVIPVKISSQNEIDGIIYEASASRQTVFVEPKEVASLNNRLRQRQNELIQEIYIVLEGTSRELSGFSPEITLAVETIAYWDAVYARARLGRTYSGKMIRVTEDRQFVMKQTAHPLLWWSLSPDAIIRNDIDFGQPARTLLLTGPNTGGKTVLLKTLGLAGICARTGFLFPATDFPTIPYFDSFFADLGDSQSIEHHLSSFSGHILKFKEILDLNTDRSLILIDELNSATDPEEGAAFGRAVLETIMGRNGMIVTTTHDPHLKALALSDSRILNASMTFDEGSRTPTYRILLGVPGRSRALETAERLGIPNEVVQLARRYLSKEHNVFETMLAKLELDSREMQRAKREAEYLRDDAERLKKEWTTRTEASVNEMLEKTRIKLRRIVEKAQDEVRSSVQKLDELRNRRDVDLTRAKLSETFQIAKSGIESALEEEAPSIAHNLKKREEENLSGGLALDPKKLEIGSTVRISKWKSIGTVLEVTGSKVKVATGKIQMSVSLQDLELVSPPASRPSPVRAQVSALESLSPQIDLRGSRLDDAMAELGHYLDQAFRSGSMQEVTIVHGLGTGALREGTLKLLHALPYIKTFRSGGAGHGGAGATIVEFDRS